MSAALAIFALLPGPIVASFKPEGRAWRAWLDGLTIALVGGLCVFHLIPHAFAHGGFLALGLCAVAAAIPAVLHRLKANEGPAAAIALGALALHALLDGAALAVVAEGNAMAMAIAAHRLPVGLAVFSAAASLRLGWAAIALLIVASWVGFAAGAPLTGLGGEALEGALEAIVAGALLHVVLGGHGHDHSHTHDAPEPPQTAFTVAGAAVGLIVFGALSWAAL